MEARNSLSALGSAGAFRVRRAAVPVLSASLMDAGRRTECGFSVDRCVLRLHMACAGGCWHCDVRFGATLAAPPRRNVCGGAICRQSLSSGDRLLAQRVCGTAGELPGAVVAVVCVEGGGRRKRELEAGGCASGSGAGGRVADECSGGGDDSLFAGAADGVLCVATEICPIAHRGSRGGSAGCVPGGVLSSSGDLRAEVDRHCAGRVAGIAAGG